ncbi:MAG: hypothetical protein R6W77_06395 [Trueperaceae bacterium]
MVEQGRHGALLATAGVYRSLYDEQFTQVAPLREELREDTRQPVGAGEGGRDA